MKIDGEIIQKFLLRHLLLNYFKRYWKLPHVCLQLSIHKKRFSTRISHHTSYFLWPNFFAPSPFSQSQSLFLYSFITKDNFQDTLSFVFIYLFIISSINPSKIISEGKKSRKTEDGEMEKKRQCNNKILFVSVDLTLLWKEKKVHRFISKVLSLLG